jgi:hypothetical protein
MGRGNGNAKQRVATGDYKVPELATAKQTAI